MTILTPQLLVDGVVNGLLYGLIALALVLVHRSTKVINFAVANMGLVGSALFPFLVIGHDVPFWLALPLVLAAGTLFGAAVDLLVMRRLFSAPRVIVLVATIGVAQLALAIVLAYPEIDTSGASYPVVSADAWTPLSDLRITGTQIAVLAVTPVLAAALGWFLNRTLLGKAVKAAASNPELARLHGVNPKIVSTGVWALSGLLSTLCMVFISGQNGSAGELALLGPTTLVRALTAAAIARFTSFPVALLGGLGLGLMEAVVQFNWLDENGLPDMAVLLVALVAVFTARRTTSDERAVFSFVPKTRAIPERLRGVWWLRHLRLLGPVLLGGTALALPFVLTTSSRQLTATLVLTYAICAVSVTMLTGWAGQVSLGQMALAGVGALTAAALHRGARVPVGDTVLVLAALPFPVAVLLAAAGTALLAALIGAGALRVPGLLLAVTTFAFGVACEQYIYRSSFFMDGPGSSTAAFPRTTALGVDITGQRTYYYLVLAVLAGVLLVTARLRRTGIGRTTIGVRDNAQGAAAYTVVPARVKLRTFALAGAVAGLGGALLGAALETVPYADKHFLSENSLMLVAIVVVGGLASTSGPVLGSIWVVGLPAAFPDSQLAGLLASGLGLLLLLLYFPGGLVQIGYTAREFLITWAERRLGPEPEKAPGPSVAVVRTARPPLPDDAAVLTVSGLRVAFGGITAVDGVSLDVRANEIIGLIGTNGAGKTTLVNAIGGFCPATGSVQVLGRDVGGFGPSRRAALGMGRTFQAATLFPELTVRETIQVALEARDRTGLAATALFLPGSFRGERAKRAAAEDLIGFLGLGRYAGTLTGDLSTGTRRIVELAGLLALDARLLCLDEPTAGLAQGEAEAFGPLLIEIRRELGASVLVIEHDLPLITSVSDRLYCLEAGRVISTGVPEAVRADPKVIASYLGTDERAIARSGAAPDAVLHPTQEGTPHP